MKKIEPTFLSFVSLEKLTNKINLTLSEFLYAYVMRISVGVCLIVTALKTIKTTKILSN